MTDGTRRRYVMVRDIRLGARHIGWLVAVPVVMAGCSSGGDKPSGSPTSSSGSTPTPTSSAAVSYVDAVNDLCEDLIPKVLAVRIGPEGSKPTRTEFVIEHPKLEPVYKVFDAQVDALPVSAADKAAADAFVAYRAWLNEWDVKLQAAAATGDDGTFEDALHRFDVDFDSSDEPATMHQAGIQCPAR